MGGRGSSGGKTAKAAAFKAPSLTGSDRQKQYAADILKGPHDSLGRGAASEENVAKQVGWNTKSRAKYDAYVSAQNRYASEIGALSQRGPVNAGQVIERRSIFTARAKQLAEDEFRKRGLPLYEVRVT